MADEQIATTGDTTASANTETVISTPAESPAVVDAPINGSGKEVVETTPDRATLEAKTAERLKVIRELDEPSGEPEVIAEPKEGEEPPAEPEEGEEAQPEAKEQPPEAKTPTGPTLPDAYRRSLKAYDWTDEEIDKAFKNNPLEFTVTAQRLHSNRNKETSQWADAGRAARAVQPPPETVKTEPHIDPKTGGFKLLDVGAMAEEFGNEELIQKIVGPINAVLSRVNSVLPDLTSGIQTVQRSKTEQLTKTIDAFFGQKELQPYAEAYGKDTASLTEAQIETRNKVLEMADALVAGAAQQGRKLTVNDALLMAHDHVGSGLKTQTVRKEIQQAVTKRNAGLTLRPTAAGKGGNSSGPAANKTEMEARTRQRLAAVFGS